jgi:multiple sugar transport system permease protein
MMFKKRSLPANILLYALLIIWAIICVFPFYWLLTTSFKQPLAVNRLPTYLPYTGDTRQLPGEIRNFFFVPTGDHWNFLFTTQREQTTRHFRNSVIAAVFATIGSVIIGTMAGYGLSRFKYYWARLKWSNDNIAFWIISQRFLPPATIVVPFMMFYGALGLTDTHFGLILAYTSFNLPFTVWIMRDFFNSLPVELEESARVDGATRWQAFMRIVLPLSTPGLVTVSLFAFIFSWNEYLFSLMLTAFDALTMPVYIAGQSNTRGVEWWYIAALTLVMVAPVLLIGLFLQRYITRGLVSGALKS